MNRKFLAVLIFINLCFLSFSQKTTPDDVLGELVNDSDIPRSTVINKADSLLGRSDDPSWKYECYYAKGICYEDMGMFELSLENYEKAMRLAVRMDSIWPMMQAHLGLGNMYLHRGMMHEAGTNFDKLLSLANESNDPGARITANTSMAIYKKNTQDYDAAFIYVRKTIGLVKSESNESYRTNSILQVNYNTIAGLFLITNDLDSAYHYANLALDLYEKTNLFDGKVAALGTLAKYYEEKDQVEKAQLILLDIIESMEDKGWENKFVEYYDELSQFYERHGNIEDALSYSRKFQEKQLFIDSLGNANRLFELNLIFEHGIDELKLKLASEKLKTLDEEARRRTMNYVVVFLILGIIIAWLALVIRKRKLESVKNRRELIGEKRKSHKEKLIADLEKELLEKKMEWKNISLSNTAILAARKSEIIDHLSNKIEELYKIQDLSLMKDELKEELDYLKDQLTVDKNKLALQTKVLEIEENFYDKLKLQFPLLTKSDLELCGLIKLNLTSKEISIIRNNTPETIKTARNRLRKKLELTSDPMKTIDFLNKI